MHGGATWGMLTELKADNVSFADNTVLSVFERCEAMASKHMYAEFASQP